MVSVCPVSGSQGSRRASWEAGCRSLPRSARVGILRALARWGKHYFPISLFFISCTQPVATSLLLYSLDPSLPTIYSGYSICVYNASSFIRESSRIVRSKRSGLGASGWIVILKSRNKQRSRLLKHAIFGNSLAMRRLGRPSCLPALSIAASEHLGNGSCCPTKAVYLNLSFIDAL
jgi:hypothetical protein